MDNPWLQQLHFVIRANAFLTGEIAKRAFMKKQVKYVIIATDTSANHQQLLIERLTFYRIPYVIRLTQTDLTKLTKKKQVAFIAITNVDLAKTLIEKESSYEKNIPSPSRKHPGEPGEN